MKTKKWTQASTALLMAILLMLSTACGSNDVSSTKSEENNESGKQQVIDGIIEELPPLSDKVTDKTVKFLTSKVPDITGESGATSEYIKQYGITVEYITVPGDALQNRLITMVSSDNSPDLIDGSDTSASYTLVKNNLVQPVDGLIDFTASVWDNVRTPIEKAKIGGKTYRVIQHVTFANMVWYNTKMFKEMGLKDPGYYYEKDEWDMDHLIDLATKMTVDKNNDGTMDQWGFGGHDIQYMLLGATGESFVMYDANGNYKNNFKSAKVAKAMNLMQDFWFKYNFRPDSDNNEFQALMNNKLAMGYFGQWNAVTVKGADERIAAGDLSWVPAPTFKDGERVYYGTTEDRYIAAGAKNPDGAAAVLVYTEYQENRDRQIRLSGKSDEIATPEMVKRFVENEKYINTSPVLADLPGTSHWSEEVFKRVWAMVPWSTTVEEFSPMLDAAISNAAKQ